ncbi:S-layer homology domain-containing protein [Ruminiclostridium cellobioparum]|uniref:S-layer homology domain-containing protein n=1 Tax=Ruminiclostridium cellobioparum TaxID=29355 RepID=UPI0012B6467B|nr:S-layer homology domain-containing protein [Ruminiclostridium cellobioparum]
MNITTPGNTVTTGSSIELTNEQADIQESYVKLGPLFAYAGQDMAVMTYKVSELLKVEMKESSSPVQFKDSSMISSYAVNAISAMRKSGIINGVGNDNFAPKNNATRAQAAVIIYQVFKPAQ